MSSATTEIPADSINNTNDIQQDTNNGNKKQAKSFKKTEKMFNKLNLQQITDVERVVLRKHQGVMLAVVNPIIYKSPNTDVYVVIGETQAEDLNQQAKDAADERLKKGGGAAISRETKIEETNDDEDLDESGLDEKDIQLVMDQGKVSRNKAIQALKKNNNDIVNAIMVF